MKKMIALVVLLFVLSGCTDKYLMTGLLFRTAKKPDIEKGHMTLYNEELDKYLYFNAFPIYQIVAHRVTVPSLIDRAYATSKGRKYLNKIISDSWELRFDTDIAFNGDVIPAGTDLLAIPSLRNRFTFYEEWWGYDFISDDELIDEIEFGSLEFRATICCRTDLDEEFQASANVVIRR